MKKLFPLFLCLLATVTLSLSKGEAQCLDCTFHWRQYSGPVTTDIKNPDSTTTLVTGLNKVGIYNFEFIVTNPFGESRDSCSVTVTNGTLSIHPDSVYHFQRPKITKLEIKSIIRTNDIYLQIKSPKPQDMKIIICDVLGRPFAQTEGHLKEGTNYISVPKPRVAGVYILRFITYWDARSQKIFI